MQLVKGKGVFEHHTQRRFISFYTNKNKGNGVFHVICMKGALSLPEKEKRKMKTVSDYFGSMVFDDRVMKANLSAKVYASLKKTIDEGAQLDIGVANAVADAMKDWALSKGATHFTHWFQPLTGITAEKHDAFISPSPDG